MIDNLEQRISQLREDSMADIEAMFQVEDTSVKSWVPEDGTFISLCTGEVRHTDDFRADYLNKYYKSGCMRRTEEEAQKAAIKLRQYSRLLSYVNEHASNYEPDFTTLTFKYTVGYDYIVKRWEAIYSVTCEPLGTVHMPKEVAEELAAKLNSGEVVF